MKILVIGQTGQLSQEIQQQSSQNTHGHEWIFVGRDVCNLNDAQSIADCVTAHRPQVIINAAAYTAVDLAESHVSDAFATNTFGVMHLAIQAQAIGAFVIHYSTDYVFDGNSQLPYTEDMATHPLNVYGASKRAGELALISACPNSVTLRTSWVTSPYGNNFTKTMMKLIREREELSVVSDQWGAPASTELLWHVTVQLINAYQQGAVLQSIYHVTSAGTTTWFDYADFIRGILIQRSPQQRVAHLKRIATQDYPVKAQRPLYSGLDTSAIQQVLSMSFEPWQYAIERIVDQLSA